MVDPYKEIINLLDKNRTDYELIDHKPVYTSEEAEKITGLGLDHGMKSLLLEGDGKLALAVVPGDCRVDMEKMARLMNVARVQLASKEAVEEKMNCSIGGCYPFGGIVGLRTIADPVLLEKGKLALNPGKNDKTIVLRAEDYFNVAGSEQENIVKK